ncbi:hypothetical protein M501DRAFT_1030973 [Patellaria atrata CBS 101060]|uniref:Uncharacterized protein n=1 Tax=Patellaria atrata CBS 101060 TaxID=1346257 RepID=A0A9P4SBV3_9PEZI|nr:hypothetical protein M501DRAFT_1030973 [Patellaria atrata CBS 101060]
MINLPIWAPLLIALAGLSLLLLLGGALHQLYTRYRNNRARARDTDIEAASDAAQHAARHVVNEAVAASARAAMEQRLRAQVEAEQRPVRMVVEGQGAGGVVRDARYPDMSEMGMSRLVSPQRVAVRHERGMTEEEMREQERLYEAHMRGR